MNFDSFVFNLFNFTTLSSYFAPVDLNIVSTSSVAAFVDNSLIVLDNLYQTIAHHLFCPIQFTELQTVLLTIFLVILSINLALIGFYWNKYGGVITDRFIRASECDCDDDSSSAIVFIVDMEFSINFFRFRRHFEGNRRVEIVGGEIEIAAWTYATNLKNQFGYTMSAADKIKNFFKKKKNEAKFKVNISIVRMSIVKTNCWFAYSLLVRDVVWMPPNHCQVHRNHRKMCTWHRNAMTWPMRQKQRPKLP